MDSSADEQPLLFLYDSETTGLKTYDDHIIEIAAEVVDSPVNGTFSSLVKTSRQIPAHGMISLNIENKRKYFVFL